MNTLDCCGHLPEYHHANGGCIDCDCEEGAEALPAIARKAVDRLIESFVVDCDLERPTSITVKRPDLFGGLHDTYQTETELNGWKASQGALL